MIQELHNTAREFHLSFEKVFVLYFNYGIIDAYGNETEEAKSHREHRKGSI